MIYDFIELFSGTSNMTKIFSDNNFNCLSIDYNKNSNAMLIKNILDIQPGKLKAKVIWSSPECTYFSKLAFTHHYWKKIAYHKYIPTNENTLKAIKLHKHALEIIKKSECKIYFIENPVGLLQFQDFMKNIPYKYKINQCCYGNFTKKPTHIFTNIKTNKFNKICSCNYNRFENSQSYDTSRYGLPIKLCEKILEITKDNL
jgi:hypothetical protein